MPDPLVLVIGGGFAGAEAARRLARAGSSEVLLVDIVNYSLFTPMLPEVATGDIETRHILVPHRDILPPRCFRQGRVLELDLKHRTALVETTVMPRRDEIHFDHAIFATGGMPNFFGVPGAEKNALTFRSVADAITIRNRILSLLERASVEGSAEGRERLCRVVIVGAGYSGVELAASLADFFHGTRRQFPELARFLEVVVVERQEHLAPMLPERLQEVCKNRLLSRGVKIRLGTRVASIHPDEIRLEGGDVLSTLTTVWTAGVKPTEDLARWGLPLEKTGRVEVDRFLRVSGSEVGWAVGDAARVPLPGGGFAAPTAQQAVQQGRHVAKNVLFVQKGQPPREYTYRTRGELVSLGHRSGVGTVMGIMVRGFPAWWLWRTYYLFRLPTWLRRVRVAMDWTVDLFFQKDIVQLPVADPRAQEEAEFRREDP